MRGDKGELAKNGISLLRIDTGICSTDEVKYFWDVNGLGHYDIDCDKLRAAIKERDASRRNGSSAASSNATWVAII